MSIALTPLDPRVRLFINGNWLDTTYNRVRQDNNQMMNIQLGNDNESIGDEINPGICTFTFENADGAFNPDNPMSPYYPYLGINTPLCVLLDELRDNYSRTASNTWGATDTGEVYLTKSVNGTILATDYSTDGSVGKHSVPAVSAFRMSYFDASSGGRTAYNVVQKIRFTLPFTNVTGGPLEPGNLVCRMQSDTAYYLCRLTIEADESVKLSIMKDGSSVLAAAVTVPGITHLAGQGIWVMFGAFDNLLCATAWVGDKPGDEPTGWLVSATDTNYGYGWYGVRTGVSGTNTNALPIVVSYDHYSVYNSLFNGEIPEFPQEFSDDGVDMFVPVVAGGILRRFAESKSPRPSPLRYFYETELGVSFGKKPDYYWPLDDSELSTSGRSTVGQQTAPFQFNFQLSALGGIDNSGTKHFGQAKMGAWLPNGVNVLNTEIFQALPPAGTADCVNGYWTVDWVRVGGQDTHDQFSINGYLAPGVFITGINGDIFTLEFDSVTKTVIVGQGLGEPTATLNAGVSGPLISNIYDGAAHHFRWFAQRTSGTDIFYQLYIDGQFAAGNTRFGHPFLASVGAVYASGMGTKPTGISSVAVFVTSDPSGTESLTYSRLRGTTGELADTRASRLSQENGVTTFNFTPNAAAMGPQFTGDTYFQQLQEITRTDGGIIREDIGTRGIRYDTLTNLRARTVIATLNVGGIVGQEPLALGGFKPVRDSQRLKNKIVATKRSGADYTYSKTTGRLGTADPKSGGSGVYEGTADANCSLDSQLITVAQREVSEGTVDKPRYPNVTVDLLANSIINNTSLRNQVLRLFVSQRMKLTGMQRWHTYKDADLLVIGTKRILSPYVHKITFNTIPFNSLDIFHVETVGSIMGTSASYITSPVTTAGTAFDVATDAHALWTTLGGSMPIRADIEGEDVDISSIVTTPPSFRSVGAPSHGDNATTTPGLPAGHALNDTLLCFSAIRSTTGTANVPAGYFPLTATAHYSVSSKVDNGAEVAPSCTYSGGVAGDTTSSFVIALSNCPQFHLAGNISTNVSAQDIAFIGAALPRWNGIALIFAWKQDDFTSVLPPIELTEIIEASTVIGNDQSLYAAYALLPNSVDAFAGGGTLAVTGGAAAISKGIMLYFANPQRFTVARSVNGVVKAHSALAPIKIAYPKVLG